MTRSVTEPGALPVTVGPVSQIQVQIIRVTKSCMLADRDSVTARQLTA